ncbi:hypothetical protein VitviT2T_025843 [Vitis vinifera]|uniref:non-specific serine/threonine protein kinase n=1 Tax=Vitis vinifera TaxID=29760 RepID=A0ABY9DK43_VITVI|nr:LEAF RUST 10 DISEASE-RESISTANCE LOCUS RECEPTOR-LIKE PROTEIN KINASE-like 1.2 isoform X2 [Vitis vinifera]WKA08093.1 hypothetical protein VitviT2T_025843 [Vitis vinifera]|eukprot:XP_010663615.1 PREDICTED: LEAF RUST 10 DISEASE-RESISTANCE LOCUS RECEPTOR-LIKE PROTEIN KINASE-like 1.2 isoform X1 [Vitis vinifera]
MHLKDFFPSSLVISLFISILSHGFPKYVCGIDFRYATCNSSAECGRLGKIHYPFWVNGSQPWYCGYPWFGLYCHKDEATMWILSELFHVIDMDNRTQTLKIARIYEPSTGNFFCPVFNASIKSTSFSYSSDVEFITFLYNCPPIEGLSSYEYHCVVVNKKQIHSYFVANTSLANRFRSRCGYSALLPVLGSAVEGLMNGSLDVEKALSKGFEVKWTANESQCEGCMESGGRCGYDRNLNTPSCFCRDRPYPESCSRSSKGLNYHRKVIIGVCAGLGTLLISSIFFLMYLRRYKKRYPPPLFSRNISSDPSSKTIFESQGSLHGVHIFTYEELEEATNNFDSSKELGDGGFGTVYHGKLRDGRVVAVKRLYENNYKRVEQFMNEVEILQLLRHRNLVSLYGCTSRHSRELLLVYEYVPNGTVADHLHGEQAKPGSLTWPTRMKIAIETASALKYLHASDIIHRDVKTNNILLDSNFSVKVADFGLSRLFPTDVTHVSTAPQGTPGYVDPDYHQCYQLTSKSDVYSFGVVLIELISSMPAVDITRHRHEINLSNMAINKIQNHALHELVDRSLGFDSDQNIRRMIMAVAELAFQCLQNEKEMRPAMDEVLEVLMGIESEGCNIVKTEEVEIPADSVGLLKSKQPPASPDSVTTNWTSWPSTTNGSS